MFPNAPLSTLNVGRLTSEACGIPAEERDVFEQTVRIWVADDMKHHRGSLKQLVSSHHTNSSDEQSYDPANISSHKPHLPLSVNVSTCDQDKLEEFEYYAENAWLGIILSIVAGLSLTLISLVRRHTQLKTLDADILSFWDFLLSSIPSVIVMLILEDPILPPISDHKSYTLLTIHVISASFVSICTTFSAARLSGTTAAIIGCFALIWLLLAQYTVLAEVNPGHNNVFEYLGLVLVFIGSLGQPISTLIHASRKTGGTNEKSQLIGLDEKEASKHIVTTRMPSGYKMTVSSK